MGNMLEAYDTLRAHAPRAGVRRRHVWLDVTPKSKSGCERREEAGCNFSPAALDPWSERPLRPHRLEA